MNILFAISLIIVSVLAGLFGLIAQDFGIPIESAKKTDLLAAIQKWLQSRQSEGDSPVIVIDEAQALSTRALAIRPQPDELSDPPNARRADRL